MVTVLESKVYKQNPVQDQKAMLKTLETATTKMLKSIQRHQEICDGIDNNCNTTVDDDENGWLQSSGTYFYNDLDADGFGGPGYAEIACSGREGMVDNIDDCNDSDFRINPLASEICDDIDNDCDRLIDDEDDCWRWQIPFMPMVTTMDLGT